MSHNTSHRRSRALRGRGQPAPVSSSRCRRLRTRCPALGRRRDLGNEPVSVLPGYEQSLRVFDAHPPEIDIIQPREDGFRYHRGTLAHPDGRKWLVHIADTRRGEDTLWDLQFKCSIFAEGARFVHEVRLDDGQFIRWTVGIGSGDDVTAGVTTTEDATGPASTAFSTIGGWPPISSKSKSSSGTSRALRSRVLRTGSSSTDPSMEPHDHGLTVHRCGVRRSPRVLSSTHNTA